MKATDKPAADSCPVLCSSCAELIEGSHLEWVLCGGQTAGMEKPSYVWQLRDKNEPVNVARQTKDLQRLATACRLIHALRGYVAGVNADCEEDEDRDELLGRIDRFLKQSHE